MQGRSRNMGCLVGLVIVAFLAFQLMGGLGGGGEAPSGPINVEPAVEEPAPAEDAAADDAAAADADATADEEATADEGEGDASMEMMGEDIVINDVRWQMLEVMDLGDSIGDGELVADGRFVGIRYEVENQTDDVLTMTGVELIDDAGNEYGYSTDALVYIDEPEDCEVVDLEPDTPVICTAVYDVEADAAGLQAELTDLNMLGGDIQLVDLGLE